MPNGKRSACWMLAHTWVEMLCSHTITALQLFWGEETRGQNSGVRVQASPSLWQESSVVCAAFGDNFLIRGVITEATTWRCNAQKPPWLTHASHERPFVFLNGEKPHRKWDSKRQSGARFTKIWIYAFFKTGRKHQIVNDGYVWMCFKFSFFSFQIFYNECDFL